MAELPRLAVIRNPSSGTAVDPAALQDALNAAGLKADILDAPHGSAAESALDRIAADHDILVAAGGDGTVSAVATAAAKAGKTIGIIPAGTLNHFARDLGIPTDVNQAVALIRNGVQRCIDVGVINDRFFLNNVSLGNYPRMVNVRDALERRGRSRTMATTIAVAKTWWRLRKLTAAFSIDDRQLVRRSPFYLIGNGSYTLSGLAVGQREQINDGHLSLYVAPPNGRLGVLTLPFRALFGTLEQHEQFETICATRISAVFSHRHLAAAIDGEVRELQTPLEFSVKRNALRLLVAPP